MREDMLTYPEQRTNNITSHLKTTLILFVQARSFSFNGVQSRSIRCDIRIHILHLHWISEFAKKPSVLYFFFGVCLESVSGPLPLLLRLKYLNSSLLRPVRNRGLSLVLAGPPLLDEGQELRLAGDVFPQNLGDGEALGGLVVFEDAAECAFSCANWSRHQHD